MPDGQSGHNIAMLGAPTSGKTTFLAALSIAFSRREYEGRSQQWKVIGVDDASTSALVRLTLSLTNDRKFPEATALAVELYRWMLIGPAWRTVKRRWLGSKQVPETLKVGLELVDASGELAKPGLASSPEGKKLIDNILKCRGIIFFFDPAFESRAGKSFYYMYGVLAELAKRAANSDDFDGWLPQYVAVCVSKFDDQRVLETAEKLDILIRDPEDVYGFPRVDEGDARNFFRQLCRIMDADNADLVMNALEGHFREDRIKYFVSSAIGFYVDPDVGVYDPDDMQNLLPHPIVQYSSRIRGGIHPINVVEPFLWLAEKLTGARVSW